MGIARVGDETTGVCSVHGQQTGKIVTGSTSVFCETVAVARKGDTVLANCGHTGVIDSSSDNTFAQGNAIARQGDGFSGTYSGTIAKSSNTVFCNGV